jgi:DNA polymerase III delta prime subunit
VSKELSVNQEINERVSKIYIDNIPKLIAWADSKDNAETIKSIIGLANGCHEIKSGILNFINVNNIYCANILFRSLIEHYSKFLMVVYRFSKENNNSVGLDNLIYAKAYEIKSYGNALKLHKNLRGEDDSKVDYSVAIRKFSEDAANKKSEELKSASEQFNYRNVVKHFESDENNFFKEQLDVFAPMILEYSELSTFVHGGPEANENGADNSDEYKRRIFENSIMLVSAVYSLSCLSLSRDFPQTSQYFHEINSIVNGNYA